MSVRSEIYSGTLQDVHPDQLCSLWATADLVLEEILSLKRGKMDTEQSVNHLNFHGLFFSAALSNISTQECFSSPHLQLTLALSKLRICPWKAAGLFRAAAQNISVCL